MDSLKKWISLVGTEPALLLYMCAAFLKYPVFQSLLYEKGCLEHYDREYCNDESAVYDDKTLQHWVNHFYMLSSLCLIVPSVFSALLLGLLSDSWNVKIPMLIPFVGLILGDLNYLVQVAKIDYNPYYLLISDLVFGVCGGYTAIIGTLLSYNVKITRMEDRSNRVAVFEGSIGLGSTLGLVVSGVLRMLIGYSYSFLLMMVLKVVGFFYLLFFTKDVSMNNEEEGEQPKSMCSRLYEIVELARNFRHRPNFLVLSFVLLALSVEMLVYAGIADILYSFLRFRLGWNDKPYGWFNGIASGLNSVNVLLLYPFMHKIGFRDVSLSILGMLTKITFCTMFAFTFSAWWAYMTVIPMSFNRFVSTGLRTTCSQLVDTNEQGKFMSIIALLEGVTGILATFIFNGLYPATLDFFAGTTFLVVAGSLVLPLGLLIIVYRKTNVSDDDGDAMNSVSEQPNIPNERLD